MHVKRLLVISFTSINDVIILNIALMLYLLHFLVVFLYKRTIPFYCLISLFLKLLTKNSRIVKNNVRVPNRGSWNIKGLDSFIFSWIPFQGWINPLEDHPNICRHVLVLLVLKPNNRLRRRWTKCVINKLTKLNLN